jgi:autoinducer 2-degrading protein
MLPRLNLSQVTAYAFDEQKEPFMNILVVSIDVLPEHVDKFIVETLANARGTRTEPGNLRFDVLRSEDDPNHFTLYEVFASPDAMAAHHETPHFKLWAATVEPWLAAPRTRVRSTPIFFGDDEV